MTTTTATTTALTMLAEMMDPDLERATGQLADLGIRHLDLKQHVFGRAIEDLDDRARTALADLTARTGVEIVCFSSRLGHVDAVAMGERTFRRHLATGLDNLLATAALARPRMIRLLACRAGGDETSGGVALLDRDAPWVFAAYREACARIRAAGIVATIENEPDSVLASPAETLAFFARLGPLDGGGLTWDIQNMWQSGAYPSLAAYEALKPLITCVHLKGGRASPDDPERLAFRAPLEDATWPVAEVVGRVLADGVSPVICLNPSHGATPPGYAHEAPGGIRATVRAEALRDLAFLRSTFPNRFA